jgi:hypothetical protein
LDDICGRTIVCVSANRQRFRRGLFGFESRSSRFAHRDFVANDSLRGPAGQYAGYRYGSRVENFEADLGAFDSMHHHYLAYALLEGFVGFRSVSPSRMFGLCLS